MFYAGIFVQLNFFEIFSKKPEKKVLTKGGGSDIINKSPQERGQAGGRKESKVFPEDGESNLNN